MAEFLTREEADDAYGSKGKTNAGLTLGIVGTALASGLLGGGNGGGGILGLGLGRNNNNCCGCNCNNGNEGAGLAMAGLLMSANQGPNSWDICQKEMLDQEYDLVRMGKIEADALRTSMATREIDIAEKADIYRQSVVDNNYLRDKIDSNKDFTINGLADVYRASVVEDRALERTIGANKLEAYKNVADLYATTVVADKNLELQIECNREKDQAEKFALYKDLSGQTNKLAFESMRQSYEDRMESMNQFNCLSNRVCALEKQEAVNSATIPLMFRLAETNTAGAITAATCRKIDGQLGLPANQISNPLPQCAINSLYSGASCPPFPYYGNFGPERNGCGCGCNGTV